MGALTGLDDLINRATGGAAQAPQHIWYHKSSSNVNIAQYFGSMWGVEGMRWGAGATPSSAAVPDNTTPGGILQTDPTGGRQLWMTSYQGKVTGTGYMVFYDRLLHCGGLDGNVNTSQTVGGSITRYTNGLGNYILAENYSSVGNSSSTITGSYTNQAGTPGCTIPVATNYVIGSNSINAFPFGAMPLPLASGDTGVQALASVTLTNATGSVGNWGVSIIHPLVMIPCCTTGGGYVLDYTEWIPEIPVDACIGMYYQRTATTIIGTGHMVLIEA